MSLIPLARPACPLAARSIITRFNIYGNHSDPAALNPTWAKEVMRRSVWVLSPAGFAYRRLLLADEANLP